MPAPSNYHQFPEPSKQTSSTIRQTPSAFSVMRLAKLWRPNGFLMEMVISTLARVSLRVVNRITGVAYSADELEEKILGQVGAIDPVFPNVTITGELEEEVLLEIEAGGVIFFQWKEVGSVSHNALVQFLVGPGFTFDGSALTDARSHSLPDASGDLAVSMTTLPASPSSGSTINAARYIDRFYYWNPPGTLAALTFNLPGAADARDQQKIQIYSSQTVTALTVGAGSGNTVSGVALTAMVANTVYTFQYIKDYNRWLRVQAG